MQWVEQWQEMIGIDSRSLLDNLIANALPDSPTTTNDKLDDLVPE
jgi:hypothetical protein